MKVCRLPDCERKHYGHDLCHLHYQRLKRSGSFEATDNSILKDPIERFWAYVVKTEPEACWLWDGGLSKGYGSYGGLWTKLAHKISYELTYDKVPLGMQLDHLCHTRNCVNPEHLEVVSNRENTVRGDKVSKKVRSLPVGVQPNRNATKYQALKQWSGDRLYIGTFDTPEQASIAYETAILA